MFSEENPLENKDALVETLDEILVGFVAYGVENHYYRTH